MPRDSRRRSPESSRRRRKERRNSRDQPSAPAADSSLPGPMPGSMPEDDSPSADTPQPRSETRTRAYPDFQSQQYPSQSFQQQSYPQTPSQYPPTEYSQQYPPPPSQQYSYQQYPSQQFEPPQNQSYYNPSPQPQAYGQHQHQQPHQYQQPQPQGTRPHAGHNSDSSSSTSSSFLNISRRKRYTKYGNVFTTFFRAPSEAGSDRSSQRHRSRKKKKTTFLSFNNSSSSSVDSDLAYGRGYIPRGNDFSSASATTGARRAPGASPSQQQRSAEPRQHPLDPNRPAPPNRTKTDEEILAIGRQLSDIARKQNDADLRASGKNRPSQLVAAATAVSSFRRTNTGDSKRDRGIGSSRPHGDDGDSDWESASEDEDSSDDGGLAYGGDVPEKKSNFGAVAGGAALAAGAAGLYGLSQNNGHRRGQDSLVDPRLFGPQNSLRGLITPLPDDPRQQDANRHSVPHPQRADAPQTPSQRSSARPERSSSMQHVHPVPISDPNSFDYGRGSASASRQVSSQTARPAPVPIQQPVPVAPVSSRVYEADSYADDVRRREAKHARSKSDGRLLKGTAAAGVAAAAIGVGAAIASDRKEPRDYRRDDRGFDRRDDRRYAPEASDPYDRDRRERDGRSYRDQKVRIVDERDQPRSSAQDDDPYASGLSRRHTAPVETLKDYAYKLPQGDEIRVEYDREGDREKDRRRRDDVRERGVDDHKPIVMDDRQRSAPSEPPVQPKQKEKQRVEPPEAPTQKAAVDPFQFQVNDFQTPPIEAPRRPLTPQVFTVEREPDFSDMSKFVKPPSPRDTRLSRKDSFEIEQRMEEENRGSRNRSRTPEPSRRHVYEEEEHAAKSILDEAKHATAPVPAAAFAAAVAIENERSRERRQAEVDSDGSRSRSAAARDAVQEEADRYYRESVIARKIAEDQLRSRSASPNHDQSIVDKYQEDESPNIVTIVPPPAMEEEEEEDPAKHGPYAAPNADVRIDNEIVPTELSRFRLPDGRLGSGEDPFWKTRDPSCERDRPLLNLVRPTPVGTPNPDKEDRWTTRDAPTREASSEPKSVPDIVIGPRGEVIQSPSTPKSVTWGENETKSFEPESPEPSHSDDGEKEAKPRAKLGKGSGWGILAGVLAGGAMLAKSDEPETKKTEEEGSRSLDNEERSSSRRSYADDEEEPPVPGPKPASPSATDISPMPGSFGNDNEFAAVLAAGLQDTGFDPNIVIDDPAYRRRDSPPGSNGEFYHHPTAETVTDLGVYDEAPRDRSAPDGGFVMGEVGDASPKDQDVEDDWASSSKLSKKERKKREKAAKRQSVENDTDILNTWEDQIPEPTPEIPAEPVVDDVSFEKLSKKERKKREKAAAREIVVVQDEPPAADTPDDWASSQPAVVAEDDEWAAPTTSKKKKKKGKKSVDVSEEPEERTVSVPVDSFDDLQAAREPEPAADEWDLPKKSKKKSKRDSGAFDSPSRPASEVSVSSSSKKDRRKSSDYAEPDDYVDDSGGLPPDRDRGRHSFVDDRDVTSVVSDPSSRYERRHNNGTRYDDDDTRSVTSFASAPDGRKSSKDAKRGKGLEKRSSGSFFGIFGRNNSDSKEEDQKRKSDKDQSSFLDNAGTLGAGVGLAGAAAALGYAASRQNATDVPSEEETSSRSRGVEELPSGSEARAVDYIDPEIIERIIKPAIDPQYGDLLPLPPSEPSSPKRDGGDEDELPALPDSRPETPPEERNRLLQKPTHGRRRSTHDTPMKSPSHTAIPLQLRLGQRSNPSSPGFFKSSPVASPEIASVPELTTPKRPTRPTSWDSSREIKPLYLLEHSRPHNRDEELSLDLPELPPSEPSESSRQSPAPGTDSQGLAAKDATEEAPFSRGLRLDTDQHLYSGSQETTPKAEVQPEPQAIDVRSAFLDDVPLPVAADKSDSQALVPNDELVELPPLPQSTSKTPGLEEEGDSYPVDPMSKDRSSYLLYSTPPSMKKSLPADVEAVSPDATPSKRAPVDVMKDIQEEPADNSEPRKSGIWGAVAGAAAGGLAAAGLWAASGKEGDKDDKRDIHIDEREAVPAPEVETSPVDEWSTPTASKKKKGKKGKKNKEAVLDDPVEVPPSLVEPASTFDEAPAADAPLEPVADSSQPPEEVAEPKLSKKDKKKKKKAQPLDDWTVEEPQEASESLGDAIPSAPDAGPAEVIDREALAPMDDDPAADTFAPVSKKDKKKKKKAQPLDDWAVEEPQETSESLGDAIPSAVDAGPADVVDREALAPMDDGPSADNFAPVSKKDKKKKKKAQGWDVTLPEEPQELREPLDDVEQPVADVQDAELQDTPTYATTTEPDVADVESTPTEPAAAESEFAPLSKKDKKKKRKSQSRGLDDWAAAPEEPQEIAPEVLDPAEQSVEPAPDVLDAGDSTPTDPKAAEEVFAPISKKDKKKKKKMAALESSEWPADEPVDEPAADSRDAASVLASEEATIADSQAPQSDFEPVSQKDSKKKKKQKKSQAAWDDWAAEETTEAPQPSDSYVAPVVDSGPSESIVTTESVPTEPLADDNVIAAVSKKDKKKKKKAPNLDDIWAADEPQESSKSLDAAEAVPDNSFPADSEAPVEQPPADSSVTATSDKKKKKKKGKKASTWTDDEPSASEPASAAQTPPRSPRIEVTEALPSQADEVPLESARTPVMPAITKSSELGTRTLEPSLGAPMLSGFSEESRDDLDSVSNWEDAQDTQPTEYFHDSFDQPHSTDALHVEGSIKDDASDVFFDADSQTGRETPDDLARSFDDFLGGDSEATPKVSAQVPQDQPEALDLVSSDPNAEAPVEAVPLSEDAWAKPSKKSKKKKGKKTEAEAEPMPETEIETHASMPVSSSSAPEWTTEHLEHDTTQDQSEPPVAPVAPVEPITEDPAALEQPAPADDEWSSTPTTKLSKKQKKKNKKGAEPDLGFTATEETTSTTPFDDATPAPEAPVGEEHDFTAAETGKKKKKKNRKSAILDFDQNDSLDLSNESSARDPQQEAGLDVAAIATDAQPGGKEIGAEYPEDHHDRIAGAPSEAEVQPNSGDDGPLLHAEQAGGGEATPAVEDVGVADRPEGPKDDVATYPDEPAPAEAADPVDDAPNVEQERSLDPQDDKSLEATRGTNAQAVDPALTDSGQGSAGPQELPGPALAGFGATSELPQHDRRMSETFDSANAPEVSTEDGMAVSEALSARPDDEWQATTTSSKKKGKKDKKKRQSLAFADETPLETPALVEDAPRVESAEPAPEETVPATLPAEDPVKDDETWSEPMTTGKKGKKNKKNKSLNVSAWEETEATPTAPGEDIQQDTPTEEPPAPVATATEGDISTTEPAADESEWATPTTGKKAKKGKKKKGAFTLDEPELGPAPTSEETEPAATTPEPPLDQQSFDEPPPATDDAATAETLDDTWATPATSKKKKNKKKSSAFSWEEEEPTSADNPQAKIETGEAIVQPDEPSAWDDAQAVDIPRERSLAVDEPLAAVPESGLDASLPDQPPASAEAGEPDEWSTQELSKKDKKKKKKQKAAAFDSWAEPEPSSSAGEAGLQPPDASLAAVEQATPAEEEPFDLPGSKKSKKNKKRQSLLASTLDESIPQSEPQPEEPGKEEVSDVTAVEDWTAEQTGKKGKKGKKKRQSLAFDDLGESVGEQSSAVQDDATSHDVSKSVEPTEEQPAEPVDLDAGTTLPSQEASVDVSQPSTNDNAEEAVAPAPVDDWAMPAKKSKKDKKKKKASAFDDFQDQPEVTDVPDSSEPVAQQSEEPLVQPEVQDSLPTNSEVEAKPTEGDDPIISRSSKMDKKSKKKKRGLALNDSSEWPGEDEAAPPPQVDDNGGLGERSLDDVPTSGADEPFAPSTEDDFSSSSSLSKKDKKKKKKGLLAAALTASLLPDVSAGNSTDGDGSRAVDPTTSEHETSVQPGSPVESTSQPLADPSSPLPDESMRLEDATTADEVFFAPKKSKKDKKKKTKAIEETEDEPAPHPSTEPATVIPEATVVEEAPTSWADEVEEALEQEDPPAITEAPVEEAGLPADERQQPEAAMPDDEFAFVSKKSKKDKKKKKGISLAETPPPIADPTPDTSKELDPPASFDIATTGDSALAPAPEDAVPGTPAGDEWPDESFTTSTKSKKKKKQKAAEQDDFETPVEPSASLGALNEDSGSKEVPALDSPLPEMGGALEGAADEQPASTQEWPEETFVTKKSSKKDKKKRKSKLESDLSGTATPVEEAVPQVADDNTLAEEQASSGTKVPDILPETQHILSEDQGPSATSDTAHVDTALGEPAQVEPTVDPSAQQDEWPEDSFVVGKSKKDKKKKKRASQFEPELEPEQVSQNDARADAQELQQDPQVRDSSQEAPLETADTGMPAEKAPEDTEDWTDFTALKKGKKKKKDKSAALAAFESDATPVHEKPALEDTSALLEPPTEATDAPRDDVMPDTITQVAEDLNVEPVDPVPQPVQDPADPVDEWAEPTTKKGKKGKKKAKAAASWEPELETAAEPAASADTHIEAPDADRGLSLDADAEEAKPSEPINPPMDVDQDALQSSVDEQPSAPVDEWADFTTTKTSKKKKKGKAAVAEAEPASTPLDTLQDADMTMADAPSRDVDEIQPALADEAEPAPPADEWSGFSTKKSKKNKKGKAAIVDAEPEFEAVADPAGEPSTAPTDVLDLSATTERPASPGVDQAPDAVQVPPTDDWSDFTGKKGKKKKKSKGFAFDEPESVPETTSSDVPASTLIQDDAEQAPAEPTTDEAPADTQEDIDEWSAPTSTKSKKAKKAKKGARALAWDEPTTAEDTTSSQDAQLPPVDEADAHTTPAVEEALPDTQSTSQTIEEQQPDPVAEEFSDFTTKKSKKGKKKAKALAWDEPETVEEPVPAPDDSLLPVSEAGGLEASPPQDDQQTTEPVVAEEQAPVPVAEEFPDFTTKKSKKSKKKAKALAWDEPEPEPVEDSLPAPNDSLLPVDEADSDQPLAGSEDQPIQDLVVAEEQEAPSAPPEQFSDFATKKSKKGKKKAKALVWDQPEVTEEPKSTPVADPDPAPEQDVASMEPVVAVEDPPAAEDFTEFTSAKKSKKDKKKKNARQSLDWLDDAPAATETSTPLPGDDTPMLDGPPVEVPTDLPDTQPPTLVEEPSLEAMRSIDNDNVPAPADEDHQLPEADPAPPVDPLTANDPTEGDQLGAVESQPPEDSSDFFPVQKSKKDKKKSKRASQLQADEPWPSQEEPTAVSEAQDQPPSTIDTATEPEPVEDSQVVPQEVEEPTETFSLKKSKKDKKKAKRQSLLQDSEPTTPVESPVVEAPTAILDTPMTTAEPEELLVADADADAAAVEPERPFEQPIEQPIEPSESIEDEWALPSKKKKKGKKGKGSVSVDNSAPVSRALSPIREPDVAAPEDSMPSGEPAMPTEMVSEDVPSQSEPVVEDEWALPTSKKKKKAKKGMAFTSLDVSEPSPRALSPTREDDLPPTDAGPEPQVAPEPKPLQHPETTAADAEPAVIEDEWAVPTSKKKKKGKKGQALDILEPETAPEPVLTAESTSELAPEVTEDAPKELPVDEPSAPEPAAEEEWGVTPSKKSKKDKKRAKTSAPVSRGLSPVRDESADAPVDTDIPPAEAVTATEDAWDVPVSSKKSKKGKKNKRGSVLDLGDASPAASDQATTPQDSAPDNDATGIPTWAKVGAAAAAGSLAAAALAGSKEEKTDEMQGLSYHDDKEMPSGDDARSRAIAAAYLESDHSHQAHHADKTTDAEKSPSQHVDAKNPLGIITDDTTAMHVDTQEGLDDVWGDGAQGHEGVDDVWGEDTRGNDMDDVWGEDTRGNNDLDDVWGDEPLDTKSRVANDVEMLWGGSPTSAKKGSARDIAASYLEHPHGSKKAESPKSPPAKDASSPSSRSPKGAAAAATPVAQKASGGKKKKGKGKKRFEGKTPGGGDDLFDDPVLWEGADKKHVSEAASVEVERFWGPTPGEEENEEGEQMTAVAEEAKPVEAEAEPEKEKEEEPIKLTLADKLKKEEEIEDPESPVLGREVSLQDDVPTPPAPAEPQPERMSTESMEIDQAIDRGFEDEQQRDLAATTSTEAPHVSPDLYTSAYEPQVEYRRPKSRGLPPVQEESEDFATQPLSRDLGMEDLDTHRADRDSGFVGEVTQAVRRGNFVEPETRDSGVHLRDHHDKTPRQAPRSPEPTWPRTPSRNLHGADDSSGSAMKPKLRRSPLSRGELRDSPLAKTPKLRDPGPQDITPEPQKTKRLTPEPTDKRSRYGDVGLAAGPAASLLSGRRSVSDHVARIQSPPVPPDSASSARSLRRTTSNTSLTRHRTPEPLNLSGRYSRPESPASGIFRGASATPPLRRVDKRVSGDLRSLSQRSQVELNPDLDSPSPSPDPNPNRGGLGLVTAAAAAAGAAAVVAASSSSFSNTKDQHDGGDASKTRGGPNTSTPVANEGRVRAKDMADVYDGVGEGRIGSPRSPTRPHSMRRRQSMQVLELESRLEQLTAENRMLADAKAQADAAYGSSRSAGVLADRDAEIDQLKQSLEFLQKEVARLSEVNDGLNSANAQLASQQNDRYRNLETQHGEATRELEASRSSFGAFEASLGEKDAEISRLRGELEQAKEQIRAMQQQILDSKAGDSGFLMLKDVDHFDHRCQQLCSHVQQWVLRFSKFSDMRACRLTSEINEEKVIDRLDNAVLDGFDVDTYLGDRVKRRDIFMSMTMNMIWEFVFTRYLFGMDREQRQKLKSLEKLLTEVGPPQAVRQWRAVTLTLLSKRPSFKEQRDLDTEAVVQAIFHTLSKVLPPPSNLEDQIQSQLRRVMREAVDLSVEMRTQRAEYMMLPPLQPTYDEDGELAETVTFNAALMNERSGDGTLSNEDLEAQGAVVRVVLFPLVVKKGDDAGDGDDEIVVCPAQVLVQRSHDKRRSTRLLTPSSDAGGALLGTPTATNRSDVSMSGGMYSPQQMRTPDADPYGGGH